MNRGENCFHSRQVRLDGFAKKQSVRRLQENFRDQHIASAVVIDPFDGGIRIDCEAGSGPPESLQRLRQHVGRTGPVIHDQYFH